MAGDNLFTWRDYEDHIFEQLSEWAGNDAKVQFDQTRIGKFSQVERQIDVLITGRFAGATDRDITAAVDCKYYTRNIDVKKVDEFIGFIEDVQTDIGILITNPGFSDGAKSRASRSIHLRVVVANVDRLPPVYHPSWDDSYYEGDYYPAGCFGGEDGALIRYSHIDDEALQYSFDPENPPERLDEPVMSGTTSEISWNDDAGRAACIRAILQHRNNGREPSGEDVKIVVMELAYHWEDGQPWVLYDAQLAEYGL